MGTIVSIGGGKVAEGATLAIDREIVRLTGKRQPRILFVPTASGDPPDYCAGFHSIYGGKLGCRVDTLLLYRDRPTIAETERRILGADAVYVGGGNTLRMMKLWRRLGVDRVLKQAWKRGVVLCGTSAGAICWLRWGNSDSRSFSGNPDWDYIRVHGLGLVDLAGCPHYHGERREASFAEMIRKHGGPGIALDDHTAMEIVDGAYRIITSQPLAVFEKGGRAYLLNRHRGEVVVEALSNGGRLTPLPGAAVNSSQG